MNKKKIRSIIVGVSALACVASMAIGTLNLHTANAAVMSEGVYADSFNAAQLSESWIVDDAQIVADYASLRIQPTEYAWPGHIVCRAYKLEGDCRLEMKTQRIPTQNESWFALSFGSSAATNIFEKASGALIFTNSATQVFKSGANANMLFHYSPLTGDLATEVATTTLEFTEKDNGYYDIVYTVKNGDVVVGTSTIEDFEVQDGYFGFNTFDVHFDVLSFDVYEGEEKVYADDFTTSRISHDDNVIKGSEWVALSPFTLESANIAPVGRLGLEKIGSSVTYTESFTRKTTEVSTVYELSAKFDFSSATVGVATGFEFAKPSVEEDGVFVGLVRGFATYKLVCADGERKEERDIGLNPKDGLLDMTLVTRYDNSVIVTVNGVQETFSVSGVEGYWGVATPEGYAASGNGALADDLSFERSIYKASTALDAVMNFEGTKELEDEDGKYYQYYVPTKDWYFGSNVRLANYDFATNGYALFGNASPTSSFAPKVKYNDCIVRFDVTLVGSDYFYDNPETYYDTPDGRGACDAECFGLQFGLDSYQNIYANAQSLGIATYNGKSIYYTTNCTRASGQNEIVHRPSADGSATAEYDLFRKSATYNFMYIIRNGTVSMHFKEANEPESVLGIVREYVTGVKTNGYVSVYGANGVDFRLDNFSVVNLDRSLTSSKYVGGENVETFRADLAKGDALSALTQKQNGWETQGVIENHIARITLDDVSGLTYRHGGLQIHFTEQGATVSDGVKTEEIAFAFPLVYRGATIEISRIGDEVTLAFVNAAAPLSAIDENVYTVKGLQGAQRAKIEILGNTGVSLSKIALFNLDSIATISARDFDEAVDIMQPWAERENLQGKDVNTDSSQVNGCQSSVALPAVLCFLPFVWVLAKKEKENA